MDFSKGDKRKSFFESFKDKIPSGIDTISKFKDYLDNVKGFGGLLASGKKK